MAPSHKDIPESTVSRRKRRLFRFKRKAAPSSPRVIGEVFRKPKTGLHEYITSRWLLGEKLSAMVPEEAGAGKSSLMDAFAMYWPENELTVEKVTTTGCDTLLFLSF